MLWAFLCGIGEGECSLPVSKVSRENKQTSINVCFIMSGSTTSSPGQQTEGTECFIYILTDPRFTCLLTCNPAPRIACKTLLLWLMHLNKICGKVSLILCSLNLCRSGHATILLSRPKDSTEFHSTPGSFFTKGNPLYCASEQTAENR